MNSSEIVAPPQPEGSRQADGQFRNGTVLPRDGFLKKLRIGVKYLLLRKPAGTRPRQEIPVQNLDREQLVAAPTTASGAWGTRPCC